MNFYLNIINSILNKMNIIQYLQDNNYDGMIDHVKINQIFYKKNIMVSYETENDDNGVKRTSRRYIFSARQRNNKDVDIDSDLLVHEANGVILEAPGWKPLVISTFTPKFQFDNKVVNKFIQQNSYNIYKLEDGTIINLYYYNSANKWIISTAKGIEVNNVSFNTKNYETIFNECLISLKFIPKKFFKELDKSTVYTLGIKHPDMHTFSEGKNPVCKIWFVQKVSIDNELKRLTTITTSPWKAIKPHQPYKVKKISEVFNNCKTSYMNYQDNNVVDYGYILIAKNPNDFANNISYTTIICESVLMSYIRRLSYISISKKTDLCFSRTRVIVIINAFLDDKKTEAYNVLFPEHNPVMEKLISIEIDLINTIYEKITDTHTILKKDESTEAFEQEDQTEPVLITSEQNEKNSIINILREQVVSYLDITRYENPKLKIRDIIHNAANVHYYNTLYTEVAIIG